MISGLISTQAGNNKDRIRHDKAGNVFIDDITSGSNPISDEFPSRVDQAVVHRCQWL
jgi:hypothetical protein